jgi:hypothetical protein
MFSATTRRVLVASSATLADLLPEVFNRSCIGGITENEVTTQPRLPGCGGSHTWTPSRAFGKLGYTHYRRASCWRIGCFSACGRRVALSAETFRGGVGWNLSADADRNDSETKLDSKLIRDGEEGQIQQRMKIQFLELKFGRTRPC